MWTSAGQFSSNYGPNIEKFKFSNPHISPKWGPILLIQKIFSQSPQDYNVHESHRVSAPPSGQNEKWTKVQNFEPVFLKNGSSEFFTNFCVERTHESPSICKFRGKLIMGKNCISKFSKILLGGPDPQTVPNILPGSGRFVGAVDLRPRWLRSRARLNRCREIWGRKKNFGTT